MKAGTVLDKLLDRKLPEKLSIDLFDPKEVNQEHYLKARAEYIASRVKWETKKEIAEADWDALYPRGMNDWSLSRTQLNAWGEQQVINKINDIIDYLKKSGA